MIEIPGYILNKRLYEGLSTHVYQAIRSADAHPVIIKVSAQKMVTEKRALRFHREFEVGQKINSPYVIHYLELKEDPTYGIALIMEDNQATDLSTLIPAQGLSNLEFLALAIPITEGLKAIHAANIVHNDLKPSNILIQPRRTPLLSASSKHLSEKPGSSFSIESIAKTIKIIDFDQASFLRQELQPPLSIHQAKGTLEYLSPEQTGRINRSVDYRTDFYSLGVIFYCLLCGQLPFVANDALGLIHQHLAKQPLPPHRHKSTIPLPLSQLIMKLAEKEAENRYQSCEGILYDLNHCLTALQKSGTISPFTLAQQDVSNKLTISEHLYGRDNEIHILRQAFERVSQGSREALMVAGQPGVGKSMLLQEIQKSITLSTGYFINGKFDQLDKNIAYSALSQALGDLMKQLLAEDEASIADWKQRILKALGNQAQLMVQIVPALATLIGPQSPAQIADPNQAKQVFNLIFLDFTKLFADARHPLVLVLDDLQWADNSSLELMTFLLTQPGMRHLLWIGAYRDNEVSDAHPAIQALAQLKDAQIRVQTLTLLPLSRESLQHWITDSLRMPAITTQPLATLIHQKTAGNPFFVKSFLRTLYDQQLLNFLPKIHWQWDLIKIRQHPASENVISLMTNQIEQLPSVTREALMMISCLGHCLPLSLLQIVLARSHERVLEVLRPALNSGIVLQVDDSIKFVHDRVQEAAYRLIADTEKARIHLTLGQRLLASPLGSDVLLFETVTQLNQAYILITEHSERLRMAHLNLRAAEKARCATTYTMALKYLYAIQHWLDIKALWISNYSLAFTWQKELAEVEYFSGHFEASEALIKNMQPHLQSTLDKVDILSLYILQKIVQGLYQEAITIGQQALQLLGSGLPLDKLTDFNQKTASDIKQKLRDKPVSSLLDMPLVVDPEKRAIFKILASIHSAAYLSGRDLLFATVLMATNLSLIYGNTPESCHSYASYGILLCDELQEYALAYDFGNLAICLAEKLHSPTNLTRSAYLFCAFILSWLKPLRELPSLFTRHMEQGLAYGEIEYVSYMANYKVTTLFYQGTPLATVQQEILPLLQFVQNTKSSIAINVVQTVQRIIANLRGETQNELKFDINAIDDNKFEEQFRQKNSFYALCLYHIQKALVFYLYGHFEKALSSLTLAKKNLAFIPADFAKALYNWYDSLTRLALYSSVPPAEQQAYLQQINQNQQSMQKWQSSGPENFAHKYVLVQAQVAQLKKDYEEAETCYEQAIMLASRHGFIQEHALAAELTARYWLARGRPMAAQGYMNTALNSYKYWGAKRKVELLKAQHTDLLQALTHPNLSQIAINQETTLSGNTLRQLDLSSILKATQTISREIELSKLLRNMMQLIIENAGAQKGALLLVEAGESIFVQAEYAPNGTISTLQKIPLAEWTNGALTVIQSVKRMHQTVVIDNAITHEQFKMDPYIRQSQTKSILCVPLLQYAELKALLYLENSLLSYVFIPERVQTVLILTTQMSISLENARYFAEQIALTKQLAEQSARAQMAEESLHAVNDNLQLALQASKAGTWNWQLDTNHIVWDAGTCALHGLTLDTFKGTFEAVMACVHPEDRESLQQDVKRCIEQDIPFMRDDRVIWPDRSEHVITAHGRVSRDKNGVAIKMAGVCLDITRSKQLERERLAAIKKVNEEHIRSEEASRFQQMQKTFTEMVCHELRNPLQGMISATELLKIDMEALSQDFMTMPLPELKSCLTQRMVNCKEYMVDLKEGTDHLQTLLNDVLNLAKLSAKKMELCINIFQPKAIIQSVAKMFAAKITEKKLALHVQLPPDEVCVKGDEQRLRQIMINLLANALKFTEKGNITMELKVLGVTKTHTQLKFVVADTGIGMTKEEMTRLFKPFSQADTDTASKYGGTGLGLEISDKLVKLMNSQIIVSSEKGKGSQFSFVIECEHAEPKAISKGGIFTAFKSATPSVPMNLPGRKILIAEDILINQKLLARMIQNLGYTACTANNGKEAVQCFMETGPFSLIFMDIEMPEMKGDEAAKQIRKIEQERQLTPTPIICISGHANDEYQQKILSANMNAFLAKPFLQETVRQIVAVWVKTPSLVKNKP